MVALVAQLVTVNPSCSLPLDLAVIFFKMISGRMWRVSGSLSSVGVVVHSPLLGYNPLGYLTFLSISWSFIRSALTRNSSSAVS